MSFEVVEHCYEPRRFAHTLYDLVENDGVAIISTPYHGYVKNLALAVAGSWTVISARFGTAVTSSFLGLRGIEWVIFGADRTTKPRFT